MTIDDAQVELDSRTREHPGFVGTGKISDAGEQRLILYVNNLWRQPTPQSIGGFAVEVRRIGTVRPS
jgi:hypothetical protein